MHRLRPILLLLFVVGVLFVAAEPESALAHTKVHPGAVALTETARVADAPTAPSPVVLTVSLAIVACAAIVLHARRTAPPVRRSRADVERRWSDQLPRQAFARRGPPAPVF